MKPVPLVSAELRYVTLLLAFGSLGLHWNAMGVPGQAKLKPFSRVSITVTSFAATVPVFVMISVYWIVPPLMPPPGFGTGSGPSSLVIWRSTDGVLVGVTVLVTV